MAFTLSRVEDICGERGSINVGEIEWGRLIDCFGLYPVSAIFQPCNGGEWGRRMRKKNEEEDTKECET